MMRREDDRVRRCGGGCCRGEHTAGAEEVARQSGVDGKMGWW